MMNMFVSPCYGQFCSSGRIYVRAQRVLIYTYMFMSKWTTGCLCSLCHRLGQVMRSSHNIWSYQVWFCRFHYYRHLTSYRLVTETNKIRLYQNISEYKRVQSQPVWFGRYQHNECLLTLGQVRLHFLSHFRGWSAKQKSQMVPKNECMPKDLELSGLVWYILLLSAYYMLQVGHENKKVILYQNIRACKRKNNGFKKIKKNFKVTILYTGSACVQLRNIYLLSNVISIDQYSKYEVTSECQ